jgi:hypothetical protein
MVGASLALPRRPLCQGLAGLARVLLGRTLSIGEARLKVVKHITRCAAVNVDPDTAARELDIPAALMRRFGHNECGIYTEVTCAGTVSVGERSRWKSRSCRRKGAFAPCRCLHPSPSPSRLPLTRKTPQLVELLTETTEVSVRRAPSLVSASLHRGTDGTKVVMYAQWESIEHTRRCARTLPHSRFFKKRSRSRSSNPASTKSCKPSHPSVIRKRRRFKTASPREDERGEAKEARDQFGTT